MTRCINGAEPSSVLRTGCHEVTSMHSFEDLKRRRTVLRDYLVSLWTRVLQAPLKACVGWLDGPVNALIDSFFLVQRGALCTDAKSLQPTTSC